MFRQRLLTAIVLVLCVLFLLYVNNVWLFSLVILFLVGMSGYEWLQLIPLTGRSQQLAFIFVLLSCCVASLFWPWLWISVGIVLWVGIIIAVVVYPAGQIYWGRQIFIGIACWLLIPLFVCTLVLLYQHDSGSAYILYVLCFVWAADTGAYLIGKVLGKHKLIPAVSPGKTLEGAIGGLSCALIVACVGVIYFHPLHKIWWFGLAVCTFTMSIIGDLFFSMLKRRNHVKDSGNLLPGHGGVLDRIDSWLVAVPIFYCGLYCMM